MQDHARLQLDLQYNRFFEILDTANQEEAGKLFCVADFVGDLCKAMASRIRGAVSSITFDDFHRNSAKIIEVAVFGLDSAPRGKEMVDGLWFIPVILDYLSLLYLTTI